MGTLPGKSLGAEEKVSYRKKKPLRFNLEENRLSITGGRPIRGESTKKTRLGGTQNMGKGISEEKFLPFT